MNSLVGHVLTIGYNTMKTIILSSSDGGRRSDDDVESIVEMKEKKYYPRPNDE